MIGATNVLISSILFSLFLVFGSNYYFVMPMRIFGCAGAYRFIFDWLEVRKKGHLHFSYFVRFTVFHIVMEYVLGHPSMYDAVKFHLTLHIGAYLLTRVDLNYKILGRSYLAGNLALAIDHVDMLMGVLPNTYGMDSMAVFVQKFLIVDPRIMIFNTFWAANEALIEGRLLVFRFIMLYIFGKIAFYFTLLSFHGAEEPSLPLMVAGWNVLIWGQDEVAKLLGLYPYT